jgi:hypothetical protein
MWSRSLSWISFLIGTCVSIGVQAQRAGSSFQTPISTFLFYPEKKESIQKHANKRMEKKDSHHSDTIYDYGLFNPIETLSTLSETEFTTLGHPAFPRYSVRIKKTSFCDETVKFVFWLLEIFVEPIAYTSFLFFSFV